MNTRNPQSGERYLTIAERELVARYENAGDRLDDVLFDLNARYGASWKAPASKRSVARKLKRQLDELRTQLRDLGVFGPSMEPQS